MSNTSRNWRYNTSGQLLYRYSNRTSYYIRVSGDSWQVNTTQGNASTIEFELYNPTYKVKLTSFEEGYSVIYGDYENTYAQTLTDATPTKNITLRTVTSTKDLTLRTVTSTKNFTPIAYVSTKNFTLNVYTPTGNFTPSGYTPEFVFSTSLYSSAKDITVELENIMYSFTDTVLLVMSYDLDEQKTFTTTTQTNQKTGFTTYMPIRVPQSSEADYDADNLYKASSKNTGYIIGGGNYYENNTSVGDIRVSRYAKSNISKYTGAITTLHTVDGSGNRALTEEDTEKYLSFNDVTTTEKDEQGNEVEVTLPGAKSQFDSMIGSFADGLHFMDSLISKDRLITVPQATILNRTYYDYQLPQDCIDFKVLKRGAISFFAGEYFSGNNAFFSLHQIFRDNNQNITDIKEIIYVYKYKNAKLGTADYIYLYDDDSYGRINQETGDFEVVQYDDISNVLTYYEIAFNTAWITNPTGVSSNNQYVYYFEIPCNKGEYALGSVDGKIGAYLLYLDIAANGGDEVDSVVSGQGNDVSTSFKVDFRSPGETSEFAIMQLFINCPNEANASSTDVNERLFNVNVVFDSTETGDGVYSSGIYNIYITNKVAGSTAKVDVFLVDTDNDIMTPFPYAFRIIYTNIDYENVTILNIAELDFYQSVGSFEIPATGTAVETSYN